MCTYKASGASDAAGSRPKPAARRSRPRRQLIAQRAQRLAAMAQTILFRGRSSAAVLLEVGQPKIGVVAKATAAARRIENESLPIRLGDQRRRIRGALDEHQRAAVARAAAAPAAHRPARAAAWRCSPHRPRPHRRSAPNKCQARRSGHRLRAPSRRRLPPSPLTAAAWRALSSAFARKVAPVSVRCAQSKFRRAGQFERQSGEQSAKFAQLAGIAGGDHQPAERSFLSIPASSGLRSSGAGTELCGMQLRDALRCKVQ